jgi:hypothetical protein
MWIRIHSRWIQIQSGSTTLKFTVKCVRRNIFVKWTTPHTLNFNSESVRYEIILFANRYGTDSIFFKTKSTVRNHRGWKNPKISFSWYKRSKKVSFFIFIFFQLCIHKKSMQNLNKFRADPVRILVAQRVGANRRGEHMAIHVPWAAVHPARAGAVATGVTPNVAPDTYKLLLKEHEKKY